MYGDAGISKVVEDDNRIHVTIYGVQGRFFSHACRSILGVYRRKLQRLESHLPNTSWQEYRWILYGSDAALSVLVFYRRLACSVTPNLEPLGTHSSRNDNVFFALPLRRVEVLFV